MAQDKEDKLKKLIQSVELDQPKADFTATIMQQIEAQESLVSSVALQVLLEKHLMESPSADFTENVMMDIERLDKKVVYEPIISKEVWYGVSIAAALLITLVSFVGKSSKTNIDVPPLANNINQLTGKIILQINGLPGLVLACLFAVSSLLLLEHFFSKKKYQI
ncbi:hypothetical protein [Emticicia soli]|uniref:Uncharacterized protein n=1 Tax=Emticicia soli TaxID=2027878 RepID=A0ABW5J802_9BACT